MCQERLSQDPSQEELPARSHRLHEDGPWGCEQDHGCFSHFPQQTRPERVHLPTPLGKKAYSANINSPQLPFLLGTRTVREAWVSSPLFTSALLGAAPAVREVLPSMGTISPPNSCLPWARPLLHSAEPSHGSPILMRDPHPWRAAPDGFWALPSYTHCDESCQPLALSWWPAGGWEASPSAQAAHPIRQTAGAPAVSPRADGGAGWDTELAPHGRVQHHTLPDWTCLTAARPGHLNETWKQHKALGEHMKISW